MNSRICVGLTLLVAVCSCTLPALAAFVQSHNGIASTGAPATAPGSGEVNVVFGEISPRTIAWVFHESESWVGNAVVQGGMQEQIFYGLENDTSESWTGFNITMSGPGVDLLAANGVTPLRASNPVVNEGPVGPGLIFSPIHAASVSVLSSQIIRGPDTITLSMIFDIPFDPGDLATLVPVGGANKFFIKGSGPVEIINTPVVPEPSAMLLALVGAALAIGWRCRGRLTTQR